MDSISENFAKFNPFQSKHHDNEDFGEAVDNQTLAGGGHAGRVTATTRHLNVSSALRSFLVDDNTLSKGDADIDNPSQTSASLRALTEKPHAIVPPELMDRSCPLPDYYVSSSHNTYLLAGQLYGTSSASAYQIALESGARCVEIDAWDGENKDEPKVTHGYTLTTHIPFRKVCETIRDVVDREAAEAVDVQGYRKAPILISLENHCDAHGQQRLVDIMKEVFGDRLLSKPVRDKYQDTNEHVRLDELGSKIAIIVEYHFPNQAADDSDQEVDEPLKDSYAEYQAQKAVAPSAIIIPALSELGVYAQSVKPPNNAWFEKGILDPSPHHPLINISETGLASHIPQHARQIAAHNANHLMRVYPKGTRIYSANLNPVPFWELGAQICALNWQTFGQSAQLNEALFTGTDGYVLKPQHLRQGFTGLAERSQRKRLRLHVAGATDIPVPKDREQDGSDTKPYLTCTLIDPSHMRASGDPVKRKTHPYKQHKLGMLHRGPNPPNTEPLWDEVLEWEYEDDDLVFLRMLIKSDDAFAANPMFAVNAVRLLYVQKNQWVFIRMLDLKGRETACSICVKFEIENI